jgi:hypothetical protein
MPNLAVVSRHNGKHLQGISGKKSVTTSCKHWNAILIRFSLQNYKIILTSNILPAFINNKKFVIYYIK